MHYTSGVWVTELVWDEHNEAHIARHAVSSTEAEEVVFALGTRWIQDDIHRQGRLVALGQTEAGRWLVVVCDRPVAGGLAYVVTARPMTARERRDYEGSADDQQG